MVLEHKYFLLHPSDTPIVLEMLTHIKILNFLNLFFNFLFLVYNVLSRVQWFIKLNDTKILNRIHKWQSFDQNYCFD